MTVKNYRKKPVVIQAIQLTKDNVREVYNFLHGAPISNFRDKWENYEDIVKRDGMKIETLEGTMRADLGDWIIKGIGGEFYPCKPDIFEKTYEPA